MFKQLLEQKFNQQHLIRMVVDWLGSISFYLISLALVLTDIKHYRIPNILVLFLLVSVLFFRFIDGDLSFFDFFPSIFLIFIFWIFDKFRFGLVGGGDIKYMMVASLYLGYLVFPYFLIVFGILATLFILFWQKSKPNKDVPMMPTLALGVLVCELFVK